MNSSQYVFSLFVLLTLMISSYIYIYYGKKIEYNLKFDMTHLSPPANIAPKLETNQ